MKKVFYFDSSYPDGHINMEERTFQNLSQYYSLYIMSPLGWYKNTPSNARMILVKDYRKFASKSIIHELIRDLLNIINARKIIKKIKPDVVVVGDYENLLFPLYKIILGNKTRIMLMHHNNIDRMQRHGFQETLFNISKNKVGHIVLEEYVRDCLINRYAVNRCFVYFWPHPLYKSASSISLGYDCVGISNSNDDNIIHQIIKNEERHLFLKESGLHVLLRSKKYSFDNGYLKVINGWINNHEYQNYINSAKCIFAPFSSELFKYRPSGTIIDAFSRRICVIASNTLLAQDYCKKYPGACKIFKLTTFVNDIKDCCVNNIKMDVFDNFFELHSDKNIQKMMRESIDVFCKK